MGILDSRCYVWLGTSSFQFARSTAAARAAAVLGVNLQTLSDCVFLPADVTQSMSAIDRLENFVSALYSQLLQSITYLINRLVLVDFYFLYSTLFLTSVDISVGITSKLMGGVMTSDIEPGQFLRGPLWEGPNLLRGPPLGSQ